MATFAHPSSAFPSNSRSSSAPPSDHAAVLNHLQARGSGLVASASLSPQLQMPTNSRWTGDPPHATVGQRAGQAILHHNPQLDVRSRATQLAANNGRSQLPQLQQASLADHGLVEHADEDKALGRRESVLSQGGSYLDTEADDEENALSEMERRERAYHDLPRGTFDPHAQRRVIEHSRQMSPSEQVAEQYNKHQAQLARSSPGPQLINHPSNHEHQPLPAPEAGTDGLGSPFLERNPAPIAKDGTVHPSLSASAPLPGSSHPPTAQRPRPRKTSEGGASVNSGIDKTELVERLLAALTESRTETEAAQLALKTEREKRRKVEASLSKKQLVIKELNDALNEADDNALRTSKDYDDLKRVATLMRSSHKKQVDELRAIMEQQDAALRAMKDELDAWKTKASLAHEAAEVRPELARRALYMLGGHGLDNEPNLQYTSHFLEEIGRDAVGESLASDAGSRTDDGSTRGPTPVPTRWPAAIDDGSESKAAELARIVTARKARLDAALTGIETSAFDSDSVRTTKGKPLPPPEPIVLAPDNTTVSTEGPPKTQRKTSAAGVARFVFGVGSRRLSRSNSLNGGSGGRSRSGSLGTGNRAFSSSTVHITEATPIQPASASSSSKPGGDTGKLLPPQLRMAQGEGTYGRSASSDIPRNEVPTVASSPPKAANGARPRKLSLTDVIAKGVRAVFPTLGPGTSTTNLPDDSSNEKSARWPEEDDLRYATAYH